MLVQFDAAAAGLANAAALTLDQLVRGAHDPVQQAEQNQAAEQGNHGHQRAPPAQRFEQCPGRFIQLDHADDTLLVLVPDRNVALDELVHVCRQEIVLQLFLLPRLALVEDTDTLVGQFEFVVVVEGFAHQFAIVGPDDLIIRIENGSAEYVGNSDDVIEKLLDRAFVLGAGAAIEIGLGIVDQRYALDELGADDHFALQQVLLQKRKINVPGYHADTNDRDECGQREYSEQAPSLDKRRQVHDDRP